MAHDTAPAGVRARLDPPQTRVLLASFVLDADPFDGAPVPEPHVTVSRIGADRWLAIAEPADTGARRPAPGGARRPRRGGGRDGRPPPPPARRTGRPGRARAGDPGSPDEIGPSVVQTEMMGMAVQVRAPEPGIVDLGLPRSAAASLVSAVAHAAAAHGWVLLDRGSGEESA